MTNITTPLQRATGQPTLLLGVSSQTKYMDRSTLSSGTSYWVSGPLVLDGDPGAEHTLRQFFLEYVSDNSGANITLNFSGDGGKTWGSNHTIAISDTDGGIEVGSVASTVTGRDLRVKITLPTLSKVRVTAIEPVIVQRGNP